jgi:hypothetical protein
VHGDGGMTTKEIWLPAVGYETFCRVSNFGRVRSVRRFNAACNRYYGGKILKPAKYSNGYLCINLGIATCGLQISLHRLILTTFVGPCPDGMEGCHNDGNKKNCRLSNLRWDTRKNNAIDRVNHGVSRGEKNPGSKLTDHAVRLIRTSNKPDTYWAEKFGVRPTIIYQARRGRTWKHVDVPPSKPRPTNWRYDNQI